MYQPRSISKQRPAPSAPQVDMVEPSSAIMINLESITSANESLAQKEAETASVLSQFTPLSIAPVNPSGDHFEVDRDRVRELSQPSLRELSVDEAPLPDMGDFKPKRRGLLIFLLLLVAWVAFTSAQVGVQALMSDPVEATRIALGGEPPQVVVNAGPQIEEVIEVGELTVTLSEPTIYAKDWVVVEGRLNNSTTSSQAEVKLKVSLTFEKGAPLQEQFLCCQTLEADADRDEWVKGEVSRLKGKKESPEPEQAKVVIPPQEELRFIKVFKLPTRTYRAPQATAQVTWSEPISE